ncbi:hypothetical protein HUU40_31075 [candidate division KSB1 bacterium]|nr:hypothetical protein [candidate division KSB1 bacterium]
MVVILTNIPTPYRIPLFNRVAAELAAQQQRLHVLFAMPTYHRRQWENVLAEAQFDYTVMNLPAVPFSHEHVVAIPQGFSKKLNALQAKCLVVGGFNLMAMLGARYAFRHRIPYLIWSGETKREASRRRGRRDHHEGRAPDPSLVPCQHGFPSAPGAHRRAQPGPQDPPPTDERVISTILVTCSQRRFSAAVAAGPGAPGVPSARWLLASLSST